MKFKVDQYNYSSLFQLAEAAKYNKGNKFEIELTPKLENLPQFSMMAPLLYRLLDYEIYFSIWLKNFPFCVLNFNSWDHLLSSTNGFAGEKKRQCRKCRYFKICSGFPKGYFDKYGEKELQPVLDLPHEVMIEVEPRCNFDCQFCFNRISFAKKGRDIKGFSTAFVKKIINGIARSGVKTVRFTGGEPLLRKDIFELTKYAKAKHLEVRLNTNGSLITSQIAKKLKGKVDNVLIPIESHNDKEESKIAGYPQALKIKIKAIKLLRKGKIPIVRVGTVASKKNILNFNKMAKLILALPINEWEWYRPISDKKSAGRISHQEVETLVNKIIVAKKRSEIAISIANALPFCAIDDLNKINSISSGALFDDGHNRLVVDPRGFVKPHYFLDRNIGNPLNILGAWNHRFMKQMRNLKYLPKECANCRFEFKCRGGSRHEAKIAFGDYRALDPLARPKHLLKIN